MKRFLEVCRTVHFLIIGSPRFASALCVWLFLLLAAPLFAVLGCSCLGPFDVETELSESDNVAIFKVVSIEKYRVGEDGFGYGGIKSATLRVERSFKGRLKTGDEYQFKQGGGADCVIAFGENTIGSELLLYLGQKPSQKELWEASTCTRSRGIKSAAADILYLEKRSKYRNRSRLSGQLTQFQESAVVEQSSLSEVLKSRTVLINGQGRTVKLTTDANGVFEVYDLPPGKYSITPERVQGYRFSSDEEMAVEVEIESKEHTEQNFEFTIDNRIRVRTFDSNGMPVRGCLNLEPTFGSPSKYYRTWRSACTGSDGVAEFEGVPVGTYLITARTEGGNVSDIVWYPGHRDRSKAVTVTIGAGEIIDGLIMQLN